LDDEDEAARAYDTAARTYCSDKAKLKFPIAGDKKEVELEWQEEQQQQQQDGPKPSGLAPPYTQPLPSLPVHRKARATSEGVEGAAFWKTHNL
jgi:hypothetical protein